MTDNEWFQYLATRIAPYLPAKPDSGIDPPPPPVITPPVITPPPVVPPVAGGISPRWDALTSQWAKWNFITPAETIALQALHGVGVAQHINWWQSYHRLDGIHKSDDTYWYVDGYTAWGTPNWKQDTGGAADSKHFKDLGATPEIAPLA